MLARLIISIDDQTLYGLDDQLNMKMQFPVSTALNGAGQQSGSGCTPLGLHRVRAKIGQGSEQGSVFVGRRPTGEIYSGQLAQQFPQRDWILSRILWLQGLEWGLNRGPNIDTMARYIYIHGTPSSEPLGVAKSHGCIRMHCQDVIKLFNQVPINCAVMIQQTSFEAMAE